MQRFINRKASTAGFSKGIKDEAALRTDIVLIENLDLIKE